VGVSSLNWRIQECGPTVEDQLYHRAQELNEWKIKQARHCPDRNQREGEGGEEGREGRASLGRASKEYVHHINVEPRTPAIARVFRRPATESSRMIGSTSLMPRQ
jgi:hypothetical protein